MKKFIFLLIFLSLTDHLVAAPLFFNRSENPIEIFYKFCNFSFADNDYICGVTYQTMIKGKSYSYMSVPKEVESIMVTEAIEQNVRGIIARGIYNTNCKASFYRQDFNPRENKQTLNPVITFDDMFQSSVIICDTHATSGDLS